MDKSPSAELIVNHYLL